MKDYLRDILQHDFNVQVLSENEEAILFIGYRKAHYHLVVSSGNNLSQHHIPRYYMATQFRSVYGVEWNFPDRPLHNEINHRLHAINFSGNEYGFYTNAGYFKINDDAKQEFFNEVAKDIELLEQAGNLVKKTESDFLLHRIKTPNGKNITHTNNDKLLTAVAFDYLLFKGKKKQPYGLYKLYSNVIDKENELKSMDFKRMVQFLNMIDPDKMDESIVEPFDRVQSSFFEAKIWGKGISFNADIAQKSIEKAFEKLTDIQKVMFIALNQLHGAACLHIFSFILNEIDVYQYCYPITQCYQPDSKEEQMIREEANMVELMKHLTKTNV